MPATALSRRAALAGLGAASLAMVLSHSAPAMARGAYRLSEWGGLELLDDGDNPFRLGEGETPFTLIKLWANWCPACLSELDALPAVAPALGVERVRTVLVSQPQEWARDRKILRDRNLAVRGARPSAGNRSSTVQADLLADDGWFYVPRSLLFSRASQSVVWSHVGRLDWTDDGALDPLRRLMA